MILHVPLKFHQIHGSPGTELSAAAGPGQEISHRVHKRRSLIQFLLGHFHNLPGSEMQLCIYHRPDDPMKPVHIFSVLIQFYRPDLDNLKGQLPDLPVFSIRTLVPLQIKYHVTHTLSFPAEQLFPDSPLPELSSVQYTVFAVSLQRKRIFFRLSAPDPPSPGESPPRRSAWPECFSPSVPPGSIPAFPLLGR